MTMIYAIRNDGLKFKELDLGKFDILRHKPDNVSLDDVLKFNVRNTEMQSWWKRPETEFISLTNKNAIIPDISLSMSGTLVLSPKAYRLLGELMKDYGELLPVEADGETYHLFNCLAIGEADMEKSKFDYEDEHGTKMGITHLEFPENVKDNLVFKTQAESCITIFCNDRFKDIVESYNLTGIKFDEKLLEFYD